MTEGQKRILIYSGTTEGRILAKTLAGAGIASVVCVATEYGELVMEEAEQITVLVGRKSLEDMKALLGREDFLAVVDATHPYAVEVTELIRKSVEGTKIPLFRLRRDTHGGQEKEGLRCFSSVEDCARALQETEGNILLTTGSKNLEVYAAHPGVAERLFVRVLPGKESIELCERAGIAGKQIIAMQGPFSKEMNLALMHQFHIQVMVTKESGKVGGLLQKLDAAKEAGVTTYLIGNPEKDKGDGLRQVLEKIAGLAGIPLPKLQRRITLIGMGMGKTGTLTEEAKQELAEADYVLGAERLVQPFSGQKEVRSFYLPGQILPFLEDVTLQDGGEGKVAILFSGDTGFYSGAGKVYKALQQEGYEQVKLLPGISSVSCLSARTGIAWQDAVIKSIHGKQAGQWEAEVADAVLYGEKCFLLMSGKRQVTELCLLLCKLHLSHVELHLGYQLSYPQEGVWKLCPDKWLEEMEPQAKEGLYTAVICNGMAKNRRLTCGYRDEEFLRGNVPMTKEEVREISICKLHLEESCVVYDVGSGTGSMAVEIAALSPRTAVYALECREEACALIAENAKKFHCSNLVVVPGMAPENMESLPAPTHAFIGGSRGRLMDILKSLYGKNPALRIVINAISLDTIGEFARIPKEFPVRDWELVQVQIGRAKKVGSHRLMQGENPIMICSFQFGEEQENDE